jgi:hypothetical protein
MGGKVTCPQAVSRESHRNTSTRNKNKQTKCHHSAHGHDTAVFECAKGLDFWSGGTVPVPVRETFARLMFSGEGSLTYELVYRQY